LNTRKKTGVDFYRTDTDHSYVANGPYFFNYNGVSFFSSTVNPDILGFVQGLGLNCRRLQYNSFFYVATSPLTNAFLNMRYIISPSGDIADKNVYWEVVGKTGNMLLLENKYYLPLGFMVDMKLADYKRHDDPFLAQNDFFRLATGFDGDLFDTLKFDINDSNKNDNIMARWKYQFPFSGMTYAYCIFDEPASKEKEVHLLEINFNETKPSQFLIGNNTPYIFTVGNVTPNDNITFSLQIDTKASMYIGHLNSELFELGYVKFAAQTLQMTEFTNTKVKGKITALDDGLLYTSIPADGNWKAYVDGVKHEIVLIDNAMIAVQMNKGYHEIEFRYFNTSLLAGIIVSLVSLTVFIVLALFEKRRRHSSKK
jgi:uncharacterized membrane protein YfhO